MINAKIDESRFFTAEDVSKLLGISQSSAYRVIRKLNEELESQGKIIVRGKISRRYFEEKVYI